MNTELATVEQPSSEQERAMVSFIERAASDEKVDIEKFERLIALKNSEMERQAKMAFDSAMAELQSDMPTISEKGEIKVNNQIRSKYARFEDINETIKPMLKEHGFSITFRSSFEDNMLLVTGIVAHKKGHREETTMRLPFDSSGSKNSVQAIGSSVSYGKRYVLCMLLNISTGEDDDASTVQSIGVELADDIKKRLKDSGSDVKKFLAYVGANSVDQMTHDQAEKGLAMIKNKEKSNASN